MNMLIHSCKLMSSWVTALSQEQIWRNNHVGLLHSPSLVLLLLTRRPPQNTTTWPWTRTLSKTHPLTRVVGGASLLETESKIRQSKISFFAELVSSGNFGHSHSKGIHSETCVTGRKQDSSRLCMGTYEDQKCEQLELSAICWKQRTKGIQLKIN